MKNKPIIFLSILLFVQCVGIEEEYKAPRFKEEKHLDFEILSDELMYSPHTILGCGDKIVISGYSNSGGPTCYVYDEEGELLEAGIRQGRGPAETMAGYMNVTEDNGIITYHDIMLQQSLSFNLSDFFSDDVLSVEKKQLDLPGWCSFFLEIPDGRELRIISRSYLNDLELPQRTIELMDREGDVFSYDSSPFEDRMESYYASSQPFVAVSPDGSKMVMGSSVGMVLEVFSLKDRIELTSVRKFMEPKITPNEYGYERRPDSVYGMEYLKAYEDGIYALYDGETTYSQMSGDRNRLLFRNIATFDWTGAPQMLYKTDYRVRNMCLLDGSIYAVLQDREGKCYLGKAGRVTK